MRKSGVLMHISSLPSPYGIGTMGAAARGFIDFLHSAGQTCWQVLPISPTGYGDSPYQSFSSFAGNQYFIDLDSLCARGLLKAGEFEDIDWGDNPERADFGKLYNGRSKVLETAAGRLLDEGSESFRLFCRENSYWLPDYALFMALKKKLDGAPWTDWPRGLCRREAADLKIAEMELAREIEIYKAIQFLFYSQWSQMKAYASEKGIELIGDIPMYVAMDSADVWAWQEVFCLDENRHAAEVSGCPPDAFSEDGQLWGNPLYNWSYLKETGYGWWIERIDHQYTFFDILRIDHFRGLDEFFAIPGGSENAKSGQWRKGPGMELFRALGQKKIIAEDLGFITDSARLLLKETGYPGMKVLQFAFSSREESDYLPHNHIPNCVVYSGTHDNSTTLGWFRSAPPEDIIKAKEYMRVGPGDDPVKAMLSTLWSSVAMLCVAPMQDLLGLGDEARMNTPGTAGGNWQWRMSPSARLDDISKQLYRMTKIYGRLRPHV